jgi:hypothetical protein
MDFQAQCAERKVQLDRISKLRGGRDVLVYAADLSKGNRECMLDYSDILPFQDMLASLSGKELDIIVESPGGIAEAAEDIIKLVRSKYERVGMIVPGWAKSAGTIFVMAGDEILMGAASALGPIDAQIRHPSGKGYSAHAFLEGLQKIKDEVVKSGKLNPAYIPILNNISPGEIQHCENAQSFSQTLVTEWLEKYKFKYWDVHRTSGTPVTADQKRERAREIGKTLCDQSTWLTHNRSLRIADLEEKVRLRITDYSKEPDLSDAITRYYTLLRMGFETNLYKVYETITGQVFRFLNTPTKPQVVPAKSNQADHGIAVVNCPKCQAVTKVQFNLRAGIPLEKGAVPFPDTKDVLKCQQCGTDINLKNLRLQIEAQTGKKVVC